MVRKGAAVTLVVRPGTVRTKVKVATPVATIALKTKAIRSFSRMATTMITNKFTSIAVKPSMMTVKGRKPA